jgi:hypothetical protein
MVKNQFDLGVSIFKDMFGLVKRLPAKLLRSPLCSKSATTLLS